MSFETISHVKELDDIDKEIITLRSKLKILSERKKKIMKFLTKMLTEKNEPGIKYKDLTIIADEKNKRKPLKKDEKIERGTTYLASKGIRVNETVLKELLNELKGDVEMEKYIKIKRQDKPYKDKK